MQDPLSELVNIDPKAIGVGQYQHGRNKIIANNEALNNKVLSLKKEYKRKSNVLDYEYNTKVIELEKKLEIL